MARSVVSSNEISMEDYLQSRNHRAVIVRRVHQQAPEFSLQNADVRSNGQVIRREEPLIYSYDYSSIQRLRDKPSPSVIESTDFAFEKKVLPSRSYISGQPTPQNLFIANNMITPVKQGMGHSNVEVRHVRSAMPNSRPIDARIEQSNTVDVILSNDDRDWSVRQLIDPKTENARKTSAYDVVVSDNNTPQRGHTFPQGHESVFATTVVELNIPDIGSYVGEVANGEMNGVGRILDEDGDLIYEGDFLNGRFHGLGVLWNKLSSEQTELSKPFMFTREELPFENEIENDAVITDIKPEVTLDGNGVTWKRYEGTFRDGLREGNGYLHFSNGSVYFGEFSDDQATGHGALHDSQGQHTVGLWEKGRLIQKL
jgi:hypothetical protein